MQAYVIRRGDRLSSLAASMGFDPEEVWNHEQNAPLRDLGRDPEVLAPGDVIFVPPPAEDAMTLEAKTTNRYEAYVPSSRVDVVLGFGGEPLANEPYEVQHGTGAPRSYTTDREGHARFGVPANLREVTVVLPNHRTAFVLQLGHLDPPNQRSGALQRLAGQGYLARERLFPPGAAPSNPAEEVAAATRRFQRHRELRVSGELDEATMRALDEASPEEG